MVKKNFLRKSPGEKIFTVCLYIFMALLMIVCAAPILHVAFASFSDPAWVMRQSGIILWPHGFTLDGYRLIFKTRSIITGYANTIFYVVAATGLGLLITVLAGYALSRRDLLWRNAIMMIVTFTMLFSGGMIPTYILIKKLGLFNTRAVMIIPGCVSVFNVILVRTAMQSVPAALEESARLDGAGPVTIMFKIYLPLIKATIATVTLYYAVGHWNSWFNASLYLTDRAKYPLQLILKEILIQEDASTVTQASSGELAGTADLYKQLIKYCCIMVSTVPVLCFYPFIMKYFKTGVMIGSIKG